MSFFKKIKRQKFYYYSSNILKLLIPHFIYRKALINLLNENKYPEEIITSRVNYYLNNNTIQELKNGVQLKDFVIPNGNSHYFFDLAQITKYFKKKYYISYKFGDITENQEELTIVKSRPINQTGNSVLMKLDKLRHFNFINDEIAFEDKKNKAVWRGWVENHNKRRPLLEKFKDHKIIDVKDVNSRYKEEYKKNKLTIKQQLEYKFIISIEGIDVATNLKWIMSSNSICLMPKPVYETWFMEGNLIPDYHYVLIKDDYSDIEEKINYYAKNINEAKQIIKNANNWVAQFKDEKLEKIISLKVLNEYFKKTNQV